MSTDRLAAIALFATAALGVLFMLADAAVSGLRARRDVRLVHELAVRGGWTR